MVESAIELDSLFHALSDTTRRDILERVSVSSRSVGELAAPHRMSYAAIAKHIAVLEKAHLVTKHRQGKQQIVSACPESIQTATTYLKKYEAMWRDRFSSLDNLLEKG